MILRVFLLCSLSALAACSGQHVEHTYQQYNIYGKPVTAAEAKREQENTLSNAMGLFDDSEDKETEKTGLSVNRYLWNATLDTLSFLPLQSTDAFGGVIVTDWGTTPESDGRIKVTARITSPDLRASSLTVEVYREVLDTNGNWVAASVSDDTVTQLENSILRRARQIRIAELKQ